MVATSTLVAAGTLLISCLTPAHAFYRGLAWAVDNNYAPAIDKGSLIKWYYHWAQGPVPQLSNLEYVPQFWGPSQWGSWNQRVAEMEQKTPKHILAFNEPDIPQTAINVYYAAELFMEQIYPWHKKGVLLGSVAIAFDLNYMKTWTESVESKGGHVDFFVCHWYGSWNNIAQFKSYVTALHQQTGKPVWVTELGITVSSNPSQQQVKNFMMDAFTWMAAQGWVYRASWFGCFVNTDPPDGFATGKNGFFTNGGGLSDMAYWYMYSTSPDKRRSVSRHLRLRADGDDDINDSDVEPVHCDALCQQIDQALADYEANYGPIVVAD